MWITLAVLCMSCSIGRGGAVSLPPAVQMGGAVVAAVEQDVEKALATSSQQRHQRELITQAEQQLHKLLNNELSAEQVAQLVDTWMAEGKPMVLYVDLYHS